MKTLFNLFLYLSINVIVYILNMFIKRDKKVWLFGSWMGERFADNSRFLFQYLSKNGEEYGIKKVIWVTRDDSIYLLLKEMGYEVYKLKSIKSFYYHLKSGVHVVCNHVTNDTYKPDIITALSAGAVKIQLWHGVGIKACGELRQNRKKRRKNYSWIDFVRKLSMPGMWGNCFYLATSNESARVIHEDFRIKYSKIIISSYPRLCNCIEYTKNEKIIIDLLANKKKNSRIILYLPTFRDYNDDFVYPEKINGFNDFLRENNIFWVQKKHSVSHNENDFSNGENLLSLNSDFDINVILESIDMLITDYSSATSDAIFKNKLTLEYCPDYNRYKNCDRGFVADFCSYHVDKTIIDSYDLFSRILEAFKNEDELLEKSQKVKSFLFNNNSADYDTIITDLIFKTGIKSSG